MSFCPKCNLEFDGEATFCARCGGELIASPPTESARAGELGVREVLAEANVLRLRGQWDEAIGKCTRALEMDPQSAEAHSLLGRTYEDKGEVDQAVHWLQMAADLDPADRDVRQRLENLLIMQARLRAREAALRSGPEIWYDRLWHSARFRSFVGYAVVAFLAGALVFIVGALLVLLLKGPRLESRVTPPRAVEQTRAPAPQPAPLEQPASSPTAAGTSSTASQPAQPAAPTTVRPFAEEQLLAQIRLYQILTQRGVTVEDVTLDPRRSAATVTFHIQRVSPSQGDLLMAAALVSSVLFAVKSDLEALTIRAVASLPDELGSQQWALAFQADTTRSRVASVAIATATPLQISRLFSGAYFHPKVRNTLTTP